MMTVAFSGCCKITHGFYTAEFQITCITAQQGDLSPCLTVFLLKTKIITIKLLLIFLHQCCFKQTHT